MTLRLYDTTLINTNIHETEYKIKREDDKTKYHFQKDYMIKLQKFQPRTVKYNNKQKKYYNSI
jgi:hypothetical protein